MTARPAHGPVQVVWFKRDLRIADHAPLAEAAERGPVIALYVYEHDLLRSDEFDPSHLVFINECLGELDTALRARGARLTLRAGALPEVLDRLHEECPFEALWSHQETGNRITYDRDLRVAAWAKAKGIRWTEIPQHGIFRPLRTRDGWARRWAERMGQPLAAAPAHLVSPKGLAHGRILSPRALGLPTSTKDEAVPGGESVARGVLDSFLGWRGANYRADMSSPLAGWYGCSRLSPYLAWGAISIRTVYQEALARQEEVRALKKAKAPLDPRWLGSLSSFHGRLRWHCHFMQKLEDDPRIEFENMARLYDGMREDQFDAAKFDAWCAGQTGYPMVDACMRALHRGGWINFRMRAMLMSFASYHLWLHWRPTAVYLGRHFLDFEPGIHYSQAQMQSGTTGINTVRIYSPAKQVIDQDPHGHFIRRYVPELAAVPDAYLANPERMPHAVQMASGCIIGKDYPAPIVDHATAYKEARTRVYAVRRSEAARAEAQAVYAKHGSRRRPNRHRNAPRARAQQQEHNA